MSTLMSWEIDFRKRTAGIGGFVVKFSQAPKDTTLDSDCFPNTEGVSWRGKVSRNSASIRNEATRMCLLHEATDAYGKAIRKAIDPFPSDK